MNLPNGWTFEEIEKDGWRSAEIRAAGPRRSKSLPGPLDEVRVVNGPPSARIVCYSDTREGGVEALAACIEKARSRGWEVDQLPHGTTLSGLVGELRHELRRLEEWTEPSSGANADAVRDTWAAVRRLLDRMGGR